MKKTELYKIVKEALNEVLQEQRTRRRRINPADKEKIPSVPALYCDSTLSYGTLTAYVNDPNGYMGVATGDGPKGGCQTFTIDTSWICCSQDNNYVDSVSQITSPQEFAYNLDGNITTFINWAGGSQGCQNLEGDPTWNDYVTWFSSDETSFTNTIEGNKIYRLGNLGNNGVYISNTCGVPAGEVTGCTDPNANNYDESATEDDGSCTYDEIEGCTDPNANNYDESATEDDGSCTYDEIEGCTDSDANNYDPEATEDDGSCTYDVTPTCEDELADNTGEEGACKYSFCNDDNAYNYSSTRPDGASWSVELDTADNSKCEYEGCTDNGAASSELPSTVVPGSDPVQYYYHPSNSGCQSGEGGPINGLTSTGDLNPENKDCCPVEEPTEPAEKKCRRIVAKVCNPARGIVPQTLTLPCVSIDGGVAEVGDEFKYSATYMMEEQFDPSKFNLAPNLDLQLRPKKVRAVYRIISSQIANGQTSIEDLQSGNCKGKIPQLDPVLSLKSKKAPVSPVNRDVEDSRKLREQIRKTLLNKKMKKSELKEIIKEEIKKLKSLKEQIIDWDGNCSSVLNTWSNIDDLKSLCMKCNPEIGGPGSYYMNIDPSPCDCEVPSSGGIMKPLLDFCRDKFTGAELGYGGSTPVGDPTPAPDDLTVKPTKYSKEPKPSKGKLPGGPTKAKNPSGISILKKMLRDKSRK
jgi:hypothetical protein